MPIKVYVIRREPIKIITGAKVINAGGGAVQSVNGQTGVVVLDASDVNAYPDNNPDGYVNAAGAAAAAPVQSVNGNTGAVVLTASDVGAPSGSGNSTGTNTGDQDLSGLQLKSIVVSSNVNAENDGNYTNVVTATYTDPSPVEGKGFRVVVRNGTATVGGTGYSTAGTVILRIFHSGSWANYVYQVAGGGNSPQVLYCSTTPVTITGLTTELATHIVPLPLNLGNGAIRVTYFQRMSTYVALASCRVRIGNIANPTYAQLVASPILGQTSQSSTNDMNLYRTFPVVAGSMGNIVANFNSSNFRSEHQTPNIQSVVSIDWTQQQYLYFATTPANTGNVFTSLLVLVEFYPEKL